MKIMVTGIGAVGGYIASFLCAYHDDVTLIARKKRKKALLENGLILHSDFFGEHTAHPAVTDDPASCGIQDVIFVCVKNFSLKDALTAVLPCIGDDTIVVTVMNGVDHADVARSLMSKGRVMDSVIYINAASQPDYSTRQFGNFARLCISGVEGKDSQTLKELLEHPGLTLQLVPDMQAECWTKFIRNCGINVITAFYGDSFEGSFARPNGKEELHRLLEEAATVGRTLGVKLPEALVDDIFTTVVTANHGGATSSLARDILKGNRGELDVFSGYILRQAEKLHLDVPQTRICHDAICKRLEA